jgi:transposase
MVNSLQDIENLPYEEGAKELIRELFELVLGLQRRIAELENQVAVGKKNSRTSSKPPSSDITQPKHKRKKKGRKIGGQKGHKGVKHELLSAEHVDVVSEHEVNTCPTCRVELLPEREEHVEIRQKQELVLRPVIVTEYRSYGHRCPCCDQVHYGKLPAEAETGSKYGIRFQAMVGFMNGAMGASCSEVTEFCRDVLDTPISASTVCNIRSRITDALDVPYEEVGAAVKEQSVLHIDESGWRENGKRLWLWVFCTTQMAFFALRSSRSSAVLYEILGQAFPGVIISDFFSAYVKYAPRKQQLCLAHLIRDVLFLTTLTSLQASAFGHKVLECFRRIFDLWHDRTKMGQDEFQSEIGKVSKRLRKIVHETTLDERHAVNLQKRLTKKWDSIFLFLEHPDLLEPTNNQAERTLRHAVMLRKKTQGSRGLVGRQFFERFLTVHKTCCMQRRPLFQFLVDALSARYFKTPVPSLVSAA